MRIEDVGFGGVRLVHLDPRRDDRGSFTRLFCRTTFMKSGLNMDWPQFNLSHTQDCGAVRGLHFQIPPSEEIKFVTCITGIVFDVVLDVRRDSSTFGQWRSFELSERNNVALYIPTGLAHGFQCLAGDCRMAYLMSCDFNPSAARGVRFNDPALGIPWPLPVSQVSPKDAELPSLADFR